MPWKSLNGMHRCTVQCNWGVERRRRSLAADDEREFIVRDFSAYGGPLEMVTSFKYQGQVILVTENNWPTVARNLAWAKTVWRRMSHILSREGATPWMYGLFYKAVIQAVMLFRAETWVVAPRTAQPGGVSDSGGKTADGTSLAEDNGQDVEIHLGSGGKVGGRFIDYGGICQAALEHGRTVYRYTITVKPV